MIKKNLFKSVRAKLFLTLSIVILMIIFFFIVINNTVLETIYFRSKKDASLNVYEFINEKLPKTAEEFKDEHYYSELEKLEVKDNFEILILNEENKEKIDLILLDVMMPKLDGWSVLRNIRQENKKLPIQFL